MLSIYGINLGKNSLMKVGSNMEKTIIVGSGYAGAISARILAERGEKVLVLERRPHIAGNMYDEYDENDVLVHRYGPHISVMKNKKTYDFLSRFTEWMPYQHHVNAEIEGKEVPLPFNLNSLNLLFPLEMAKELEKELIEFYGYGASVPILELKKSSSEKIRDLAAYIFEHVFLHYTEKMWGLSPDEINPAVTGRIPVRISHDDRHFLHPIQVMPKNGFTVLFRNMLNHENIEVKLNTAAETCLSLNEKNHLVFFKKEPFEGKVVYTGALDELLNYSYGVLPYRSLEFTFKSYRMEYVQTTSVLNWPDKRNYTRRTEMKRLTQQKIPGVTTVIYEEPGPYEREGKRWNEPCYPINEKKCIALYKKYAEEIARYKQIIPVGRLADYQYYNMEDTILRTLDLWEARA